MAKRNFLILLIAGLAAALAFFSVSCSKSSDNKQESDVEADEPETDETAGDEEPEADDQEEPVEADKDAESVDNPAIISGFCYMDAAYYGKALKFYLFDSYPSTKAAPKATYVPKASDVDAERGGASFFFSGLAAGEYWLAVFSDLNSNDKIDLYDEVSVYKQTIAVDPAVEGKKKVDASFEAWNSKEIKDVYTTATAILPKKYNGIGAQTAIFPKELASSADATTSFPFKAVPMEAYMTEGETVTYWAHEIKRLPPGEWRFYLILDLCADGLTEDDMTAAAAEAVVISYDGAVSADGDAEIEWISQKGALWDLKSADLSCKSEELEIEESDGDADADLEDSEPADEAEPDEEEAENVPGKIVLEGAVKTSEKFAGRRIKIALYSSNPLASSSVRPDAVYDAGALPSGTDTLNYRVENVSLQTFYMRAYIDKLNDGLDSTDPFGTYQNNPVVVSAPESESDAQVVSGLDATVLGVVAGKIKTNQLQVAHKAFVAFYTEDPKNGAAANSVYDLGVATGDPIEFWVERLSEAQYWLRAYSDRNDNGFEETDQYVDYVGSPIAVSFPTSAVVGGVIVDFASSSCEDGARVCQGNSAAVCKSGSFVPAQDCGDKGCANGVCNICELGTETCAQGALVLCQGDGWFLIENCFGVGKVCDEESKSCKACENGDKLCVGNALKKCVSGSWEVETYCADEGKICQFGECAAGQGVNGYWQARGTFSGAHDCANPPRGSIIDDVFVFSQNGSDFYMSSANNADIYEIKGTVSDQTLSGSQTTEKSVVVAEQGINCLVKTTYALAAETFPDGFMRGKITQSVTGTGNACEKVPLYAPEVPFPLSCVSEFAFSAIRYQCSYSGEEVCGNGVDDDCDGRTDEAGCLYACQNAGEYSCADNKLYLCSNDKFWRLEKDCAAEGKICDEKGGALQCVAKCDPVSNPPFCDANTIIVCNAGTGRFDRSTDCATQNKICESGACKAVGPNCSEEGRVLCNPDGINLMKCSSGAWTNIDDCADKNMDCSGDKCVPKVYTIYQIQNAAEPKRPSVNSPVKIVDAVATSNPFVLDSSSGVKAFFASEKMGGDWGALLVIMTGANLPAVKAGNVITVSGVYVEYADKQGAAKTMTAVEANSISITLQTFNPPSPALIGDPSSVADGGNKTAKLEGSLIKITVPTKLVSFDETTGEWTVTGGAVMDDLIYKYKPNSSQNYLSLAGFLYVGGGKYKIEPRNLDDIVLGCLTGEKKCESNNLMVCDSGVFKLLEACESGCSNAKCNVCEDGKFQCAANALYRCRGGLAWEQADNCQAYGLTCSDAARECKKCVNGDLMCRGTERYVCNQSGSWQQTDNCSDQMGYTCNLGSCVAGDKYDGLWLMQGAYSQGETCGHTIGAPFGLVVKLEQTGQTFSMTAPSKQWLGVSGSVVSGSTLSALTSSDVAVAEGCVLHMVHTFSAYATSDGGFVGSWMDEISGVSCPNPPPDLAKTTPCSMSVSFSMYRYLCQNYGSEVCGNGVDDDCDGVIDETDCAAKCVENDARCSGDNLQKCASNGQWKTTQNCAASLMRCNAAKKACESQCSGGKNECRESSLLYVCGTDNYLSFSEDCAESGKLCDPAFSKCASPNGSCGTEGLARCIGNSVYKCSSGVFALTDSCTGDYVCQNGKCVNPNKCQIDLDCPSGQICHTGADGGSCAPACAKSEDCVLAFGTAYPFCDKTQGYKCESALTMNSCTNNLNCASGTGQVCHKTMNGGVCAPSCAKNAFCGLYNAGYICGDYGLCVAGSGCSKNSQCLAGEVCHTAVGNGTCGASCDVDEDCQAVFGGGFKCETATHQCAPYDPNNCCGPWKYPAAGDLLINEVLARPPEGASMDSNLDGVPDPSQDEFIEIVNVSAHVLNLKNVAIYDSVTSRHVFLPGTFLYCGQAAVIWGGGAVNGAFGSSLTFVASSGGLSLGDAGDTVSVRSKDNAAITTMTYGTEGNDGLSLNLNPELNKAGTYSKHTVLSSLKYSPGTKSNGDYFVNLPSCGFNKCSSNSDCPADYVCHPDATPSGACGSACSVGEDCKLFGNGLVCNSGLCAMPVAGCSQDADCQAPKICHKEASENGTCGLMCTNNIDCVVLNGGQAGLECDSKTNRCVRRVKCSKDEECYAGEVCHLDYEGGKCAAPCESDAACSALDSGLVCNTGDNHCEWSALVPCQKDLDCGSGEFCHTTANGKYCWKHCSTAKDCALRFDDESLKCDLGVCKPPKFPICSSDLNCSGYGEVCHLQVLGGSCGPLCSQNSECKTKFGTEYYCEANRGVCNVDKSYECGSSSPCADFNVCYSSIGAYCWAPCESDASCKLIDSTYKCDASTKQCYQPKVLPCKIDYDCAVYGDRICHTFVEGGSCGYPCYSHSDCEMMLDGRDYVCQLNSSSGAYHRCVPACKSNADCASPSVCQTSVGGGVCDSKCSSTSDCAGKYGPEFACNTTSGVCERNANYKCSDSTNCAPFDYCNLNVNGGRCLPYCFSDAECLLTAGPEFVCASNNQCVVDKTYACSNDSDCSSFNVCQTFGQSSGFCGAKCLSDYNCKAEVPSSTCDLQTGKCAVKSCKVNADCAVYYVDGDEEEVEKPEFESSGQDYEPIEMEEESSLPPMVCHNMVAGGVCGEPCGSNYACGLLSGDYNYSCDLEPVSPAYGKCVIEKECATDAECKALDSSMVCQKHVGTRGLCKYPCESDAYCVSISKDNNAWCDLLSSSQTYKRCMPGESAVCVPSGLDCNTVESGMVCHIFIGDGGLCYYPCSNDQYCKNLASMKGLTGNFVCDATQQSSTYQQCISND